MPDDRSLTILFGGDAMLGRGVNTVVREHGPEHPFAELVGATLGADLFAANLECALSATPRRYSGPPKAFYFCADPAGVEVLSHARIELVSLANNHALDADPAGLQDTLRLLDGAGIAHAGAGMNVEGAAAPAVVERAGTRLGLLACCDHQADFAAAREQPGIWYLRLDEPRGQAPLLDAVATLAPQVDHVLVALHWQPNWAPVVSPGCRDLARSLVEAGARVVWGHSPHHFQGVEWIDGAAALYSTGDLVTDYAVDPGFRNDRQLLFEVTLDAEGVQRIRALPVELGFGRTSTATGPASRWIGRRFETMCEAVGSVVQRAGEWLDVLPRGEGHRP